jgi:hypothetical protein
MLMRASCEAAVCDDRRHICAEPKVASRNTAQFVTPGITPKFRMARRRMKRRRHGLGCAPCAPRETDFYKTRLLYMRPEAKLGQRLIAKPLWIAPPPFCEFNNLLRYELRREVLMMFVSTIARSTAGVKQLYNAGR